MELDLEIGASLKASSDHLARIDELNRKANAALPLWKTASVAKTIPAGQVTVLDFPSPPAGHIWNIRLITLGADDDHTNVAATQWAAYVGDPANYGLAQLVLPGGPSLGDTGLIPGFYDLGHGVLWVHSEETFFVVCYGGTVGHQFNCNIKYASFEEQYISPSMIP